ncbi:MAG: hypothetical protein ABI610_11095, partial [Acidobacteriota bacterium]
MRIRRAALLLLAASALAEVVLAQAKSKSAKAPVAASIEKQLADYAALYLPYNPQAKVAVSKAPQKLAGFGAWKVTSKGRYESLNTEATVLVSNDRKWFYEGDSFANPSPRPVRSGADVDWVTSQYAKLLKTNVRAQLA